MIAVTYWAGWVLAHPAWVLIFTACAATLAALVILMRAENRRDDRAYGAGLPPAPRRGLRSRARGTRARRPADRAACRRAGTMLAGGTSWGRRAIALRIHGITIDVTLPNRGDAQGRDVPARAPTTGRAARAHVTGSLSPRHHQEGPRVPSAPSSGAATNVPGRDGKRPDPPPTSGEAPVSTTRPDTHLYGGPGHPAGDLQAPAAGVSPPVNETGARMDGTGFQGVPSPPPQETREPARLATGAGRDAAAPWYAPELAPPAALSPWEHKTQWFSLDAIDADIRARAAAGGDA